MIYPIVIHKDPESDYGVTVPDLPGCFSAGDTMAKALSNAVEAIECHLEGILLDEENLPLGKTIEKYVNQPDYQGGTWALVDVDLSKLGGKTQRINISMPERILGKVDAFAKNSNKTRSKLLADAALEYIAVHGKANQ
ncbi:type II toxin-antitoxin system HicB family antitoxin [Pleurocapsa sp. FMAR1]|uniref:type II toxin-antitoxin system HicB family antitoxin n=1 Tax=Pleurocapsa sp. FMAR1 TaxID=3040204 RepID=UPI0029C89ED1|nr:type II toxin-antitoxin system HicB family antitoxin [Pleurocapsa sp. FMAR1]